MPLSGGYSLALSVFNIGETRISAEGILSEFTAKPNACTTAIGDKQAGAGQFAGHSEAARGLSFTAV